jgi:chemotaxis response regulator CheB
MRLEALPELLAGLPALFPAAVALCQHVGRGSPLLLPHIFGRRSRLPVSYAVHGERLSPGRVVIAPPDEPLLVSRQGRVILSRGPR